MRIDFFKKTYTLNYLANTSKNRVIFSQILLNIKHNNDIIIDITFYLLYVYTNMATLQKRKSRGYTYWSIVESRRINGKPRPVILAYLGRAEDLLKRLTEGIPQKVRSYSHGGVAALLHLAEELQVADIRSEERRVGKEW